jgi:hypothetical protein
MIKISIRLYFSFVNENDGDQINKRWFSNRAMDLNGGFQGFWGDGKIKGGDH